MSLFANTSDRLTSFVIYTVLSLAVLMAGFKILNHAARFDFYSDYLLKWENAVTRLFAQDIILPDFTGSNHVEYMDKVVKLLQKTAIEVPKSNTSRPYIYQRSKIELSQQEIFLLCLDKKIILYGLSKTTLNMIDKKVDGTVDNKKGSFKGALLKNNKDYAGIWKL